jgi:hypothetical protein
MELEMTEREALHGDLEAWLGHSDLPIITMKTAVELCEATETIVRRALKSNNIPIIEFEGEIYIPQKSAAIINDSHKSQVQSVRDCLDAAAQKHQLVTYIMLAEAVELSYSVANDRRVLAKIVETICKQSSSKHSFLLPAIARREYSMASMPPEYFFLVADRLGYKIDNDRKFVQSQTEQIWDFYSRAH